MSRKKHKSSTSATKQEIHNRDDDKCFFCSNFGIDESNLTLHNRNDIKDITVAHIFVWRKDGGLLIPKNGMCICRYHHDMLDFGLGCTIEQQIWMLRMCQMYLTLMYMEEIKDEDVKVKRR